MKTAMHAISYCNNAVLSVLCSFHKTVKPESVETCWKSLAELICWVKKTVDPKRCHVFVRTHISHPHVDVQLPQTKNARTLQRLVLSFLKKPSNSYPCVFFSNPPNPAEQHVPPAFVFSSCSQTLVTPCLHMKTYQEWVSHPRRVFNRANPLRRSFVQPASSLDKFMKAVQELKLPEPMDTPPKKSRTEPAAGVSKIRIAALRPERDHGALQHYCRLKAKYPSTRTARSI